VYGAILNKEPTPTSKRRVKSARRRNVSKAKRTIHNKSFPTPLSLEIRVHGREPSDIKDGLRAALKEARTMLSKGILGKGENVVGTTVTEDKTRHNSAFVTSLKEFEY
jgi:hypothetical protein